MFKAQQSIDLNLIKDFKKIQNEFDRNLKYI